MVGPTKFEDDQLQIATWFTAEHYRHGVRFIESRREIDEKVVKSSQIGDACRLKHYRWVNKHAMSNIELWLIRINKNKKITETI
jgi:hypothetical protein